MSRFHLGWFLGNAFSIQGWNEPGFAQGYDWTKPDLYVDTARALERACFDLFIIEDSSTIPDNYGDSMETYLKWPVMAPKFDPVVLVPYIASATKHIGIAPTLTSTFYPPFLLARLMSTLDHVTDGRIGWNIVTATNDRAAQNYGLEKQYEHDLRYDMADEYVDLCKKLWESWEPDAIVMDEATNTFADYRKVHRLDFEGKFYKSRGPLNTPRSPQGHPVFVAPGGSPRGRKFSGRNAEVVLAQAGSIPEMKKYRDDVRAHAQAFGRDPDQAKCMFVVTPIVVKNASEAAEHRANVKKMMNEKVEVSLAAMSYLTGIDFKKFDLDEPIGEIKTNGMQTILQKFAHHGPQATLREVATTPHAEEMVGTADELAEKMGAMIDEIGGDGFLIANKLKPVYINQITDQLVPALRKRQLVRTGYEHTHFRDNLMAF